MANDLVAVLGAKLDQFSRDLDQAGNMADGAVSRIESSFNNINPGFGGLAGLGAIATGAIGAITGLLAALKSVNSELTAIGEAAEFLKTTTDDVQKLRFAGTTAGISSDEALDNLRNVGKLLNDAQRNENSLTKLLDANNIAYRDRAGQLISINQLLSKGADLVSKAGTPADKTVIAQMLGLTQQWVPVLQDGAEAFNRIANTAQEAGGIIDRETIAKARNFDVAWKQSSALLSVQFKASLADVAGFLDDLITKANAYVDEINKAQGAGVGNNGQDKFDAMADSLAVLSKDALGAAQDLEQVNRVIDRYRTSKGGGDPEIIAELTRIQHAAELAAAKLELANRLIQQSNFPGGVPLPSSRPAAANAPPSNPTAIPNRDESEDAFDRAQAQSIKRTAEYKAQAEAIGQNTQAKVQAKAVADLETAAQRAGITLTETQKQKIQELAQAEGKAAQAAADRNQKLQQQNELLSFAGNQTINILDGLRNKTLTAADAVRNLSNMLITAFEQAVLLGQGPLAGILGTAAAAGSGATGGLLGAIFGGFRASGGSVNPNTPYVVGEKGPEIFTPSSAGSITPNDVARRSGGGVSVVIQQTNSYAAGMQPSDIAMVDALVKRNNPTIISATIQAIRGGTKSDSRFLGQN